MFRFRSLIAFSFRRDLLDSFLNQNASLFYGNVLDVGGKKTRKRGVFRPPLKNVDNWHYLNNDIKNNPDIVSELPLIDAENNSYDVVLLCEVIEYIFETDKLFKEIERVLKPKGTLIISSPLHHKIHGDHECDYYKFTKSFFKKQLPRSNFSIVSIKEMGNIYHVIGDLIRKENKYFIFMTKLFLKLINKISKEKNLTSQNITTGYFIVARKI